MEKQKKFFAPGFPNFNRFNFGVNNNLVNVVLNKPNLNQAKKIGGDPRKHQVFPPLNMRRK